LAANPKNQGQSIFRGVLLAHLIVVLHIVLIGLLAVTILVIGGMARYALWILVVFCALVAVFGYLFYRRLKSGGGRALKDTMQHFSEKSAGVEVRVLGGLVSFQFRGSDGPDRLPQHSASRPRLLEGPESRADREMAELIHLLATDQITPEEYSRARDQILNADS